MKFPAAVLAAAGWLTTHALVAADWPQWRGAERNGHSPDASILTPWPAGGPKRVWLFKNAGIGYSGFSIVGKRLFTMAARQGSEHAICLDPETGKELWATKLGPVYTNNWGDGPRSTPTIDGEHAYALSATGILACLKIANGKEVWRVDFIKDFQGQLQDWGYTESVLIDGDQLICTPGGSQGTMAALDKKTGKVIWRSKDLTVAAQYSSPIRIEVGGQPQYAQLLMRKVVGVSAKDGALRWETNFPGRVALIPTLLSRDDHVYATAGYGVGCQMIKLGGKEPEVVYEELSITNHHGGVILVDGKIYGHSDRGGWTCQDFMTGKLEWQNESLGKGACTYVAGHLVCVDESDGTVALVKADPKAWNEVSRFKLDPQTTLRKKEGRIWTHPVVVNGRLYLRDQDLIYCYDVK
ncbi:MAG: PQQ-binding-like beta-propeller repeat protein [Verrucomicrobiales bacterium]